MEVYVIWSFKHGAWWGLNRCGYVADLGQAGTYSREEAGDIVTDSYLLTSVAVCWPVAEQYGAPKYHPYNGAKEAVV